MINDTSAHNVILKGPLIAFGLIAFAVPANALDELEGTQVDRYTLERVDDKFIRLDKETGQMSVCVFSDENLICRMAADDRDVLVDELSKLQERIAILQNSEGEPAQKPDSSNVEKENKTATELEAEFEKAMKYSNKVMRRFFDVMKDLRKELDEEDRL